MVKNIPYLRALNTVFILIFSLFLLLPFFPLVIWSFTKQWPWPLLFPEKLTLDSWQYLFSDSGMAAAGLTNSLIVAVITLAGNLLMGIPAAKVLAQSEFKGKKAVFIILLSPLFIPYTVSIIGTHDLALKLEFLNPYVSVACGHLIVTIPYFIATLWFQFRLIGRNIQEAACVLGANGWKIFWWIEFPSLLPSILLGGVLVIIISLSQYLPTWIMSSGTLLTLPLVMFPYESSGNSSLVSAYTLWFFIPIFLLLLIYYLLLKITRRKGF
jgi:putative spermidine/putrescine transport system permease protein